jgi:TonB family protein
MEVALVPPDPQDPQAELSPEEQARQRLVQNHRLVNERRPEDNDKVSEFDHTVEHETRAPNEPDSAVATSSPPGDPDAEEARRPGEQARRPGDGETQAEGRQHDGRDPDESALRTADDGRMASDEGASSEQGRVGLRGSAEDLAQIFGRRGSLDYLDDVEEADENLLNTKRERFASFFNRVRNAVAQHWHPEVVHAARDPYGKVYGTKTRATRLRISLNRDGSLHQIWVDRPCGVDYLDEEAVRAVRAAAPFTNPPQQLVSLDSGHIDFSFNFILMIDGSKRIFRYKQ